MLRLLTKCVWLIWLFLFSSFHLSFGQQSPSSSQERERTSSQEHSNDPAPNRVDHALGADDSVPESEDEKAVRDRPVIKRFGAQPLTLEEQEEAKRLSAIAAKMGTDPTAIIGRFQTLFRYDALEGGSRASNVVGRIDIPYHKNFILRADLPYVWSNPNQPGTSNQNAVSDLLVRAGGRVYSVPGDAIFVGMDFTFPTADDKLGSGKYTGNGPRVSCLEIHILRAAPAPILGGR